MMWCRVAETELPSLESAQLAHRGVDFIDPAQHESRSIEEFAARFGQFKLWTPVQQDQTKALF